MSPLGLLRGRWCNVDKQQGRERIAAFSKFIEANGLVQPAQKVEENQLCFYEANLLDFSFKGDQATMEAPIFSLSTKADKEFWRWSSVDGKKSVEVAPGFYGRATQHDKDVLIFCISQLMAALNAGREPGRVVRFTAHDFLRSTGRSTGGVGYERFRDALNRLAGTRITTNITTGKMRAAKGFGIIDSWEIVEKLPEDGRMVAVDVKLSDWLFNSVKSKEVLTINPEYFRLRKPLERRLYEIARKHVGRQGLWDIGLEALRDKCGSTVARLRQFRGELEKIIESDTLPDFRLTLTNGSKTRFYTRETQQLAKRFTKRMVSK
jgi:plasmid replication initiation protein